MKTKLLQFSDERTYVVVFEKGDEFIDGLKTFAQEQDLAGSHFTAIGAFSEAMLGYFDPGQMRYKEIPVQEQVEVLSLVGNIADNKGDPQIHAHVVLGRSDGTTCGGHLLKAFIWPTLELVVTESPPHLQRRTDEETGLALLDLEATHQETAVE